MGDGLKILYQELNSRISSLDQGNSFQSKIIREELEKLVVRVQQLVLSELPDKVFVDGRELKKSDIYSPVTYVPSHAKGNAGHKDCEQGVIIRWVVEGQHRGVFVLYCKSRKIQRTDPTDLVWG